MPAWTCACFKPKVKEALHTDAVTHIQSKDEASCFARIDVGAEDSPPTPNGIRTYPLQETSSELGQVVKEWQHTGSLEGHSLQQVQALWDRDQAAMLRSLSGSIEVSDCIRPKPLLKSSFDRTMPAAACIIWLQ